MYNGHWYREMRKESERDRIRNHSRRSARRKTWHGISIVEEIFYRYKKYIAAFLAVLLLMVALFSYVKWLNHQSFIELKQYIKERTEASDPEEKEKVIEENIPYTSYKNIFLDVPHMSQKPELPSGCEITSLAMLLNYLHPEENVDKVELASEYLETGEPGVVSPDEKFVGNPRSSSGFGANAPVLVETAKKYFAENKTESENIVKDLTGTEFKDLLKYVTQGYPVMIWATINMLEPYTSVTWTIDGEDIPWQAQFHCMVLTGFDFDKDVYYVADPWKEDGIIEYGIEILELRYSQIGKQAVVIY